MSCSESSLGFLRAVPMTALLLRAAAIGLLFVVAAIVNAAVREKLLAPSLGQPWVLALSGRPVVARASHDCNLAVPGSEAAGSPGPVPGFP